MNVPARIFWTTMLTGAVAVACTLSLLVWVAAQTDQIAAEETKRRVAATVDGLISEREILTQDYGYWTSAFEWHRDRRDDMLYENLGTGATASDAFDMLFILHADGRPSYAYVSDGDRSDLAAYDPVLGPQIAPVIAQAPLGEEPIISGFVRLEGGIAVLSANRLKPDDLATLTPADIPVIIGAKWLDTAALAQMLLLEEMRFVETSGDLPMRSLLPLDALDGSALGYLTWQAPSPGGGLLRQVMPSVGFLMLLFLAGSWIAARASGQQTAAYLRERIQARTDFATGLLNRNGLQEVIALPHMQEHVATGRAAVIYADLDDLKHLNDTHGHAVGDTVITVTSNRLMASVRGSDYVVRMGGDEFVCLLIDNDPSGVASQVAERIAAKASRPVRHMKKEYATGLSIGIAVAECPTTWDELIARADEEMYRAKRAERAGDGFGDAALGMAG